MRTGRGIPCRICSRGDVQGVPSAIQAGTVPFQVGENKPDKPVDPAQVLSSTGSRLVWMPLKKVL
jgi:hypothetical protein